MVKVLIHKNLAQKLKDWGPRKVGSVLVLFVLVFGFGVTFFELQHQQDLRQQAAENNKGNDARLQKIKEKERKLTEGAVKGKNYNNQLTILSNNLKAHPENRDQVKQQLGVIALARKQVLLDLLEVDPKAAQALLLPEDIQGSLNSIDSSLLESKVTLTGLYSPTHIDDFQNPENTQYFDVLMVGDKRYYLYSPKDFSKIEPNSTITVEGYQVDDKILVTTGNQKGKQVLGAYVAPKYPAPPVLNLAVIVTTFADSTNSWDVNTIKARINGAPGADLTSYYKEVSYGKTIVNATVYGSFKLAETKTLCNGDVEGAIVKELDPQINFTGVNRIYFFTDCPNRYNQANGIRIWNTSEGAISASFINTTPPYTIGYSLDLQAMVHEFGHALNGVTRHAGYLGCFPDSYRSVSLLDPNCPVFDYWDPYDVMSVPPKRSVPHMNSYHKYENGWFTASNFITVNSPGTYTYTIAPIESASSPLPYAINITDSLNNPLWYLEYRQPIGFDSYFTDTTICPYCSVTKGVSIKTTARGTTADVLAIDSTPNSVQSTQNGDRVEDSENSALEPGQTFTDPERGITIKTTSADSSGATVQVTIPNNMCVRANPTISVSPSTQTALPGDTKIYTISVKNNDSSTCSPNKFGTTKNTNFPIELNTTYYPNIITLAPGATGTLTFTVSSPSIIRDGSYTIPVTIFSNSGSSAATSFTYQLSTSSDVIAPSAPTNLVATTVGSGQVNLTWSPSSDNLGVIGYYVFRDGRKIATISTPNYSDYGLLGGLSYTYYIQAFDRQNISANSASTTIATLGKTDTQAPSSTANVVAKVTKANEVSLSWTASTDETALASYQVYRDGNLAATLPATSTSFVDKNLLYSTPYSYTIVAQDTSGNLSPASDISTIITSAFGTFPPTQPTNLVATRNIACEIDLSWTQSTDADSSVAGYDIYLSFTNYKIGTTTTNSYADTKLIPGGGGFAYYVQAFDAAGNYSPPSQYSNYVSILNSAPCPTPLPLSPTPTPTPTSIVPTATPTPTSPSPTPTPTPSPTPTRIPTPTPTPTPTPLPTVPPLDSIAPSVFVTNPLNGAVLKKNSTITLSANATDNVGVSKVEFYITNKLGCPADTTAPYSCSWKMPAKPGVSYVIIAKAYDAAGNATTSSVTVSAK